MNTTIETRSRAPRARTVALALVGGGLAFAGWRLWRWWQRDEDGPTSGLGIGFGSGDGSGINLDPTDKGKAETGSGDAGLDGNKWERRTVAGVAGWRRKDIPLPTEPGGPATYQAAVLIMGDGSAIPDLAGWPQNLPVFFIHDRHAPYPEVEGGWFIDVLYGDRPPPPNRWFSCYATDSDELKVCVKQEIDNSLAVQWV